MNQKDLVEETTCDECGSGLVRGYGQHFCQDCYISNGFEALAAALHQTTAVEKQQEIPGPSPSPQELKNAFLS